MLGIAPLVTATARLTTTIVPAGCLTGSLGSYQYLSGKTHFPAHRQMHVLVYTCICIRRRRQSSFVWIMDLKAWKLTQSHPASLSTCPTCLSTCQPTTPRISMCTKGLNLGRGSRQLSSLTRTLACRSCRPTHSLAADADDLFSDDCETHGRLSLTSQGLDTDATRRSGQSKSQLNSEFADIRKRFNGRYIRLYGACDNKGF